MEQAEQVDSRRAVEELRELDDLPGGPEDAGGVAWTDEWATGARAARSGPL